MLFEDDFKQNLTYGLFHLPGIYQPWVHSESSLARTFFKTQTCRQGMWWTRGQTWRGSYSGTLTKTQPWHSWANSISTWYPGDLSAVSLVRSPEERRNRSLNNESQTDGTQERRIAALSAMCPWVGQYSIRGTCPAERVTVSPWLPLFICCYCCIKRVAPSFRISERRSVITYFAFSFTFKIRRSTEILAN